MMNYKCKDCDCRFSCNDKATCCPVCGSIEIEDIQIPIIINPNGFFIDSKIAVWLSESCNNKADIGDFTPDYIGFLRGVRTDSIVIEVGDLRHTVNNDQIKFIYNINNRKDIK